MCVTIQLGGLEKRGLVYSYLQQEYSQSDGNYSQHISNIFSIVQFLHWLNLSTNWWFLAYSQLKPKSKKYATLCNCINFWIRPIFQLVTLNLQLNNSMYHCCIVIDHSYNSFNQRITDISVIIYAIGIFLYILELSVLQV